MTNKKPHTQLYLVLPKLLNPGILRDFQDVLSAMPVACLLAQEPESGQFDRELTAQFKDLAQRHDVAFLIENNYALAKAIGADGVHLGAQAMQNEQAYELAREAVGDEAIIGCFCTSRHQTMVAAESYAQYVAIDPELETKLIESEQDATDDDMDHDLLLWSLEMLEVPCVAWNIKNVEDAAYYASKKIDFIALGEQVWRQNTPKDYIQSIYKMF